jgi:hypothetical protein
MKFILPVLALTLVTTAAQAAPQTETRQALVNCRTQKWSQVSLDRVTNQENYSYYELRLEMGSRDRQSGAGAYTDSITPIFWVDADNASLSWQPNGGFVLEGKFSGFQPENESITSIVGEPVEQDGVKGLSVKLKSGKFSDKKNYSYEFFNERFQSHIVKSGAVIEDKILFCTSAE